MVRVLGNEARETLDAEGCLKTYSSGGSGAEAIYSPAEPPPPSRMYMHQHRESYTSALALDLDLLVSA